MTHFSNNLKYLRLKKGLKQHEIKGFSGSKWSNYERDESFPGLEDFIAISKYFGVDEYTILHIDLSKGEYSHPAKGRKKSTKGEYKGEYEGEFKVKKYPKPDLSTTTEEDEKARIIHLRMPQVITVDSQGNENVVMVPVKARAGYLNGYADPEFMAKLPAYRLPGLNNGTFRLFEVEGASMNQTLYAGDLVIGSYVEQLGLLRDDRVHVVVTKNEGVVVKRVLNRLKSDGKFILKSDNYKDRDQYPAIVCDQQDVVEVWYVTGYISRQLRPPAETYNRLIDLEGRFTLLEAMVKKKL